MCCVELPVLGLNRIVKLLQSRVHTTSLSSIASDQRTPKMSQILQGALKRGFHLACVPGNDIVGISGPATTSIVVAFSAHLSAVEVVFVDVVAASLSPVVLIPYGAPPPSMKLRNALLPLSASLFSPLRQRRATPPTRRGKPRRRQHRSSCRPKIALWRQLPRALPTLPPRPPTPPSRQDGTESRPPSRSAGRSYPPPPPAGGAQERHVTARLFKISL